MQKRGQAATEFLTTYGWAVLILIIVIGLIYSLNIFNPKIENTCIGSDPIDCSDVRVKETINPNTPISLVLAASGVSTVVGQETYVKQVSLNTPIAASCSLPSLDPPINKNLANNVQKSVNCNFTTLTLKKGTKFSGTATICYILPGSTYNGGQAPCLIGTNQYQSKVLFSGMVE